MSITKFTITVDKCGHSYLNPDDLYSEVEFYRGWTISEKWLDRECKTCINHSKTDEFKKLYEFWITKNKEMLIQKSIQFRETYTPMYCEGFSLRYPYSLFLNENEVLKRRLSQLEQLEPAMKKQKINGENEELYAVLKRRLTELEQLDPAIKKQKINTDNDNLVQCEEEISQMIIRKRKVIEPCV
jgi:hypothetical protein